MSRWIAFAIPAVLLACSAGSPKGVSPLGDASSDGASSDGSTTTSPTSDDAGGFIVDSLPPADGPPPGELAKVYAHSDTTLYQLDPKTLVVTMVGPFRLASGDFPDQMTDIAIDKDGVMFGVSFSSLYRVDYTSKAGVARCAKIADLSGGLLFNGLSMIPKGMLDPDKEVMVGVTRAGDWYRIDVASGATTATSTRLGSYGGGFGSSGDTVGIIGDGVYSALVSGSDVRIGQINASSGSVKKDLGSTGISDDGLGNGIWGVGYWGGTMYGFAANGRVYSIDLKTAKTTEIPVTGGPASWWGAGVTTSAPITIPR